MSTTDYKPAAKVSDFHLFGRPGGVYINELILRPLRRAETAKVGYINELLLRPLRRAETAKVGLERQITISRVHKFSAAKFFLEESNIDFQIHEEIFFLHGLVLSERFGVNVKIKEEGGYFEFKAGPFNELVRVYTAQGKELRIDLHVRGSVHRGYSGLIDNNLGLKK